MDHLRKIYLLTRYQTEGSMATLQSPIGVF
jgi:hypothetical protein